MALDAPERRRILVIEDDPDLRALMRAALESEWIDVTEAHNGKSGLAEAFTLQPDCILLDRGLPDVDGLEVLAKLQSAQATRTIPVILCTAHDASHHVIGGLDAGADDYLVKPVDPGELAARVRAAIRRSERDGSLDPVSRLPGNRLLRDAISRRLESEEPFTFVWSDLNDFKAFVDRYGFERASQVIRRLGQLSYDLLVEAAAPEDFLGHIAGDDFVFLLDTPLAGALCEALVTTFGLAAPGFYDVEDAERGAILGEDRYGTMREFPVMSLAVAAVDVRPGDFEDREALSRFAASCKDRVKRAGGARWERFQAPER